MIGAKFNKTGHATLTTPLLGWFVIRKLEFDKSTCVQNLTILASGFIKRPPAGFIFVSGSQQIS